MERPLLLEARPLRIPLAANSRTGPLWVGLSEWVALAIDVDLALEQLTDRACSAADPARGGCGHDLVDGALAVDEGGRDLGRWPIGG